MAKNVELFCGALSQADPFEVAIFQLKIWFLIRDKKRERESEGGGWWLPIWRGLGQHEKGINK